MAKNKINSSNLKGSKYLKNIIELLRPLHNEAVDSLHPNKRTLHDAQHVFESSLLEPIIDELFTKVSAYHTSLLTLLIQRSSLLMAQ